MAAGPEARAEGLLPASPPFLSLLSVPGVVVTPGSEERNWSLGVNIQPEGCTLQLDADVATGDNPYWWECPDGDGIDPTDESRSVPMRTKTVLAGGENIESRSWTYWVGDRCTAVDSHSPARVAEITARLNRKLNACRPAAVEYELWEGAVAQAAGFPNPYLTDASLVEEIPGTFGFITALAELEQALADRSCQGTRMIHAQPRVVTAWASFGLVTYVPARLRLETLLGTVVVPGSGYTGSGPGGVISASYSHSYAYGTGGVRVFIGPPGTLNFTDLSTVDPSTNDVVARLEQDVAIVFDPCTLVSVEVNTCDERCGGGS